jgi:hypothetical protein
MSIMGDIIVLDDDELVCEFWERRCHRSQRKVQTFRCHHELFNAIPQIGKSSTLFIDKNLRGQASGLRVSRHLFAAGFKNLYVSTAEELSLQPRLNWIKGFIGKTPPDWLFGDSITAPLSKTERDELIAQMSPNQLDRYKRRMEHFLDVAHGMDAGAFAGPDLSGFNLPELVMNAWERSITMNLNDEQIKAATDHAWRLS